MSIKDQLPLCIQCHQPTPKDKALIADTKWAICNKIDCSPVCMACGADRLDDWGVCLETEKYEGCYLPECHLCHQNLTTEYRLNLPESLVKDLQGKPQVCQSCS